MPGIYRHLTDEQAEHFLERGFVTVRGAFDAADAQQWLDDAWVRFGYDRNDPGSWTDKRIHLSARSRVDARTFAPAAWGSAVELAGGEERVLLPWQWGDSFIANLGVGDDRQWQPPSPAVGGWHKDGDFFRHFLDSPEQALLTLVLWTDMGCRAVWVSRPVPACAVSGMDYRRIDPGPASRWNPTSLPSPDWMTAALITPSAVTPRRAQL